MTVAAVVERDGRFLLIEEADTYEGGRRVYNQPAGHWEPGETLVEACVRETLEDYLRLAFCGKCDGEVAGRALDPAILGTAWLTAEELRAAGPARQRSPLVLRCIEDFLAGRRYPLDLLSHVL